MCASVISRCDAAPVFEFAEHVLDFVSLLVESFVVFDLYLPVLFGRNAGFDAFVFQSFPEPIGIVAAIRQKMLGKRQIIDDQVRAFVITHLAFRQEHHNRAAHTIANGMELGVQAAFRASDTAGNIPFLRRLAAVRWALRWVASI